MIRRQVVLTKQVGKYTIRNRGQCLTDDNPCGLPDVWYTLDTVNYALCKENRSNAKQSPINIETSDTTHCSTSLTLFPALQVGGTYEIPGQTLEVAFEAGISAGRVRLLEEGKNSDPYSLVQFHFHAPSEHTINGQRFPLELHMVHNKVTPSGIKYVVFAVLFDLGTTENNWLNSWNFTDKSTHVSDTVPLPVEVSPYDAIPADKDFWAYEGSLTTPPCTEGVQFRIFQHAHPISNRQLNDFLGVFNGNYRPTQPLNGRHVARCSAGDNDDKKKGKKDSKF